MRILVLAIPLLLLAAGGEEERPTPAERSAPAEGAQEVAQQRVAPQNVCGHPIELNAQVVLESDDYGLVGEQVLRGGPLNRKSRPMFSNIGKLIVATYESGVFAESARPVLEKDGSVKVNLGTQPDNDYRTCGLCVSATIGDRILMATSGTATLSVAGRDSGFQLLLTGVRLEEVEKQEDGSWERVPDGCEVTLFRGVARIRGEDAEWIRERVRFPPGPLRGPDSR